MNTRNKFFVVSLLMLLAVVVSACAPAASSSKEAAPRTLNVNGSAQAVMAPDVAYISIGVHSENKDAKEAVASNNAQSQKVSDAIKALGVDAKDILTTNFSIFPQDEWAPTGEKLGTKFVVENTVYVTLRDLTKIGDVLAAAVDAGANNISGIQFDLVDKTKVIADARAQAMQNARLQAEELAKSAGVELGQIQTISYYNNFPQPMLYDVKAVGGAGAASVPVSGGQLTMTVEVNVVYEIK